MKRAKCWSGSDRNILVRSNDGRIREDFRSVRVCLGALMLVRGFLLRRWSIKECACGDRWIDKLVSGGSKRRLGTCTTYDDSGREPPNLLMHVARVATRLPRRAHARSQSSRFRESIGDVSDFFTAETEGRYGDDIFGKKTLSSSGMAE